MLLSVKRQLTSDKKSLNRLQPIAHFKSEVSCDVDLDEDVDVDFEELAGMFFTNSRNIYTFIYRLIYCL